MKKYRKSGGPVLRIMGGVELLQVQQRITMFRFVVAKAYPKRGSCPSGRESAFWKADGKHQGLRALDPETIGILTGEIKQLQVCYQCHLLQLLRVKGINPGVSNVDG